MLAFGSCNRQNLPQTFWSDIAALHPSLFLWMGDAVYTKSHRIEGLKAAFQELRNNEHYQGFVRNVSHIDGVWDDHDYGVNDAGGYVKDRRTRQKVYQEFLAFSGNNASSTTSEPQRDGLYHSVDVDIQGLHIKFILLDTRSFRDVHFIRSLAEIKFPLSAIIASAIRGLYSVFGLGRKYGGRVLNEEQWDWLAAQLRTSKADMHVIISSVQVLTTNPVVESWGHFPLEKRRLFNLLATHNPPNLVFLSGDVHMGEIAHAIVKREDGSISKWSEVTSSGMTHTCATGLFNKILCPLMVQMFHEHRLDDFGAYYLGKNFGTIEVKQAGDGVYDVNIAVRTLEKSRTTPAVLNVTYKIQGNSHQFSRSNIVDISYPDFYLLSIQMRISLVVAGLLAITSGLFILLKRKTKTLPKKEKLK